MSNEKMTATFPGDRSLEMTIQAAEVRGYACGRAEARYHPKPDAGDWRAAREWAERYGYRSQQRETTGEHTKAKLVDDPYGGVTTAQAVSGIRRALGRPANTSEERYANAYMRTMGPPRCAARRPWSPTHRELAVAGGLALLLVFVSGWMFYLLG